MTISRRKFAQLLGAGAAAAVARPAFSLALATESSTPVLGSTLIRLSSNENPFGPSPRALRAMEEAFAWACRYPDEQADRLVEAIAQREGARPENVLLGDGSGEILKLCADAFTGSSGENRGDVLVVADPTFEAIVQYAGRHRARVVKIPLTASYAHDLPKMLAAAENGLVYLCNPNNPTASITPKDEVRDFIAKVPDKTIILVDEAYFHYVDNPVYESVIPLVTKYPNLIVVRTFSKVYGMAGLRCGFCIAHPSVIDRLRGFQAWDSVNIMAIAAAQASLADTERVEEERRRNKETREFIVSELNRMGHETIPSQANFIMFDHKRPVVPLIAALKKRKVQVGRLFPSLPHHLRLTIGRKSEMEIFLAAYRETVAAA